MPPLPDDPAAYAAARRSAGRLQAIAGHLARWGGGRMYAGRGDRVEGVRQIAVLRANAVGDLVVALPALVALRRAYPRAWISLLGRAWHADFLTGRPSPVDEVVVIPEAIDFAAPVDPACACVLALRRRRFDLALQWHGGGRHSNAFVRQLGARVTAGLRTPDAAPLDRELPYREPHPEVLRLLEAAALVGAVGVDVEPHLAVTAADEAEAAQALAGAHSPGSHGTSGASSTRPLVVLQPGCRDGRRQWSPERFAAVGTHFMRQGARVVLNGTAAEAPTLARVCAAMPEPADDLSGCLSLGGLLGLLAGARLLVSNDTGTAHLARALGVPSVTICWIGNLAAYGPVASREHEVAVSWQLHCPRCGRQNVSEDCGHRDSVVDTVTVEQVLGLAQPLWEAAPQTHRR